MKIENKILILSLIFFIILYTVFRLIFKPVFGNSVLSGFLVAVMNFRFMVRGVRALTGDTSSGWTVIFSQLRLMGTAVLIWVCLVKLKVNIIGMLVGLSILPLCVPIVAIYNNLKGKNDGTPA